MIVSLVILLTASLFSCEQEHGNTTKDLLIGIWVFESYDGELTNMQKNTKLQDDAYGFIFHSDGKFTERKNAGFCGTPPIYYDNFYGNWELQGDSLILIDVGYWGGEMEYIMHIEHLKAKQFSFIPHYDFP